MCCGGVGRWGGDAAGLGGCRITTSLVVVVVVGIIFIVEGVRWMGLFAFKRGEFGEASFSLGGCCVEGGVGGCHWGLWSGAEVCSLKKETSRCLLSVVV